MNRTLKLILVPFLALVFSACGGGGSGGGSGGTSGGGSGGGGAAGNGGGAVACMGTSITANEANDYSFSSTLTIPPVKVQPKTNLTFDWGGVTADFVGHAVDPKKDLNTILLFEWNLTLDQLEEKLNADDLHTTDLTAQPPLSLTTNGTDTSAKLLDFGLNGCQIGAACGLLTVDQAMGYFDPSKYDPMTHIFTMMAATGKLVGQGTKMIQSFQLDSGSSNTAVTMTKDSTKLTYKANLHALTPAGIPAGKAAITLDWGKMTTNALGNQFDTTSITRAIVAHYTQSPTELEGDFLNLELIATDLFDNTNLAGTKVDFSTLTNKSGNTFPGIDGNGTWIAVLLCGACRNPAPWYLTVLKPCN